MQAVGYYISLPFLYLISVLPYWLFYGFSDLLFFLLYYVIGYRKKVVRTNIANSFPGMAADEQKRIIRKYYRYLCDLFLESFQTLTMSRSFSARRCSLDPGAKKIFDDFYAKKQSVIIVMGHYGNWEWAGNTFSLECKNQLYVIYHPLDNKYFNRLIIRMRTRFGTKLISMRDTYKEMLKNKDEISATAFIADQTPSPFGAHWTTFLNQDTPVFSGTEKIALKMNYPVVYVSVNRIKRGYYRIMAEVLFYDPRSTREGEISEAHTRKLEKEIIAAPEFWLWSHRRWKHKRPA